MIGLGDFGDLKVYLRQWGRVMGVRRGPEWDGEYSGELAGQTHVLLRAVRAETKVTPRGRRRRSYMGADGKHRSEPAPENICYGTESRGGTKPMTLDPVVELVDVAVLELHRWKKSAGVVVRLEYCAGPIGQKAKAHTASEILGERMTARQYRRELETAHVWLSGRLPTRLIA